VIDSQEADQEKLMKMMTNTSGPEYKAGKDKKTL
jgi:hypothetical protein